MLGAKEQSKANVIFHNAKVGYNKHKRNIVSKSNLFFKYWVLRVIFLYKVEEQRLDKPLKALHCDTKHLNDHNNIYRLLILQVHMRYE